MGPISFAGTPMQNKCVALINTAWLIAIPPWNFASSICIVSGAVTVTLPCPVSGIHPSAAQSAHPLVWYHSRTAFGYWCQTPVTPTHIAPVSVMPLMGRGEKGKMSSGFGPLQRREGKRGDHESLRCWLMGFKQHNICVCNAMRRGMRSVGRVSPRCVDAPLLRRPPAALHNNQHPSFPSLLHASHSLSPVFLILFCYNFPFFFFFESPSSFHVLFILIFQGNYPLFTDSLSSGWRDNVYGRQGHAASLCLFHWVFNAACLLDSFLSLRRGTCVDEDAHFFLPWRARLQCCAINQQLRSCLGSLLTYFICMCYSPFTIQLHFLFILR